MNCERYYLRQDTEDTCISQRHQKKSVNKAMKDAFQSQGCKMKDCEQLGKYCKIMLKGIRSCLSQGAGSQTNTAIQLHVDVWHLL